MAFGMSSLCFCSLGIYRAEYVVGTMVGMGRLFRFLTAGFFCCVARALAAATMPSGLAPSSPGSGGGSSGDEDRGCWSRENGLLTWFVWTLYNASWRRVLRASAFYEDGVSIAMHPTGNGKVIPLPWPLFLADLLWKPPMREVSS